MSTSKADMLTKTQKAVTFFNRLRSPEAIAKIVIVLPEAITIAFSGSFCYECGGVFEYIEDFAKDFKVINNIELRAGNTKKNSPRAFEVTYFIK